MPACPFCQYDISENLSLYGGNCPSCLIEIPGEEAVTDPGIQPEVTNPELAAAGGASWLSSVVAGVVVLAAVGGWWWTQRPESPLQAQLSHGEASPIPMSAHEDAAFEEEPIEAVTSKSAPRVVTQHVTSQGRPPDHEMKPADASVVPTTKGAGMGAAPTGVFDSIGSAPRSRAPASIVLEDSLKIEEMIGRVLTRGAKQLEQCYNQALKLDPGVKGAWYVDFTITKDGKPVTVSVEPLETSYRDIESCIERKVSRWRFQRISEPVDVARRYRFGG